MVFKINREKKSSKLSVQTFNRSHISKNGPTLICVNINSSYFLGKDGSHLPPKEVPDLNYAKLLKGCIAVIEEDLE